MLMDKLDLRKVDYLVAEWVARKVDYLVALMVVRWVALKEHCLVDYLVDLLATIRIA